MIHRAHPRSRGENYLCAALPAALRGSSPLTRGKRPAPCLASCAGGLIPAHAGKTSRARPTTCGPWAHPRSRGENASRPGNRGTSSGSSPLTRGKLRSFGGYFTCGGLIPAHAGKTPIPGRRKPPRRAHPRSRGENLRLAEEGVDVLGSSPLTRGKLSATGTAPVNRRLIPAHAGKTPAVAVSRPAAGAHPRSRGENLLRLPVGLHPAGSSPLTRGKPPPKRAQRYQERLIPAHAGKTLLEVTEKDTIGAHPRSRGENTS